MREIMRYNERIEASLKARNQKLDLVRMIRQDRTIYYVIRRNRRVEFTAETEWRAYSAFTSFCQNILLQLKIY